MSTILSIDIGYGYTKGVTPRDQAIFQSLVGPAETIRFESDVIAANGHVVALSDVDGRSFFVGEHAELQSASASQTMDVTRTGSIEQKALFYAVASELVPTNAQTVTVVTGLPVADYDEHNKAKLREMLTSEHVVRRQGKHQRRFTVETVYTIPQAIGSLFALVLDRRGKLVDSDLAGGRVGIIDVGTLTTNYVTVDRLHYVEVSSDSITTGMAEMLQKVAKDLKREYELDWKEKLGRVDRAVRERVVEIYGDRVNIAGLVDTHLDTIARKIGSKAQSLWGTGVDLKAVLLTGGGSLELAPYVRRIYPHTRTVGGNPQFANVTGYLRAGLRKFASR